ncbi:TOX high mobility group box family member 4-B-like [Tachypleus tridentatus]|uniref:TOX high mobility group box family member 4-B-like n=1 Tax=Tachypleus tridentatus TaxID=6853 RepID=UPI003FD14F31
MVRITTKNVRMSACQEEWPDSKVPDPWEVLPDPIILSPGQETSEDSDDNIPLNLLTTPSHAKNPKFLRRKKKKDPNEPQKPVSAYALFFRDTQAAIKGQNPNASFGEVSKIVASMWDSLDVDHKNDLGLSPFESLVRTKPVIALEIKDRSIPRTHQFLVRWRRTIRFVQQPVCQFYNSDDNGSVQWSLTPISLATAENPSVDLPHGRINSLRCNDTTPGSSCCKSGMDSDSSTAYGPRSSLILQQGPILQVHNQQMVPLATAYNQTMQSAQLVSDQTMHVSQTMGQQPQIQQTCLRNGCPNPAIESPDWDKEYCSNECVVSHCRDVFTAWWHQDKHQIVLPK